MSRGAEKKRTAMEKSQERRNLMLEVRTRIFDQLLEAQNGIDPVQGPTDEQRGRIEELQSELDQIHAAFNEADDNWIERSLEHFSAQRNEGEDNG